METRDARFAVETKLRRLGVEIKLLRFAVETKFTKLAVETTPVILETYPTVPKPVTVLVSFSVVTSPEMNP